MTHQQPEVLTAACESGGSLRQLFDSQHQTREVLAKALEVLLGGTEDSIWINSGGLREVGSS